MFNTPVKLLLVSALLWVAAGPAALAAQTVVGYPPPESPYRDIVPSQHITLFGGYFAARTDALGATPGSGPMFGLKYEIPVAGPAAFTARFARINSHRQSYDPTIAGTSRALGDQSVGLYLADLGFDFDLTGAKTWHNLLPVAGFGLGVITGPGVTGKDPYAFGTQFAISADAGVRVIPSNSYELRLMLGSTFFQNHYPTAYFAAPAGGTALLGSSASKSGYRSTFTFTAGLAIPLFR